MRIGLNLFFPLTTQIPWIFNPQRSPRWVATFIGYASVRPFLYFDHFHIFDLFSTSTHRLYFDLNFTSTVFDFCGQTSTSLLRPKLYFDQKYTSTCISRPIRSPDFTKGRSKQIEVK